MRNVWSFLPLALLGLLPFVGGCRNRNSAHEKLVVVYSSVDEEVARPLVEQFEKDSGIHVQLVTDTEKAKASGLLNRLIEEGDRPQCDVFLSEDPMRAAVLKKKGFAVPYQSAAAQGLLPEFSDPEHHWTGMSARVRVLLINKKHPIFKTEPLPTSVYDLIDPRYKGLACIGHPLFGTTTVHCLAIFQHLGDSKARELFEKMLENEVHVVGSDGDVSERIDKGDFAFGLTDNDDAMEAIRTSHGKKMTMAIMDEKGLGMLAPDAPVLIKNCPHPKYARRFIDFILRPETEVALGKAASQIPLRKDLKAPEGFDYPPLEAMRGMPVDYNDLAERHDRLVQGYLKDWADRNRNR